MCAFYFICLGLLKSRGGTRRPRTPRRPDQSRIGISSGSREEIFFLCLAWSVMPLLLTCSFSAKPLAHRQSMKCLQSGNQTLHATLCIQHHTLFQRSKPRKKSYRYCVPALTILAELLYQKSYRIRVHITIASFRNIYVLTLMNSTMLYSNPRIK